MEFFFQNQFIHTAQQPNSLRMVFVIFSVLALFCLGMGMPLLGFIYSGVSLLLFLIIPATNIAQKIISPQIMIPPTISRSASIADLQEQIDDLADNKIFSELHEYLNILHANQGKPHHSLMEIKQFSEQNLKQLEAEIFLFQAYSRLVSLDDLELGLQNIKKSEHAEYLINFGRALNNNGQWRFASQAIAHWAELRNISLACSSEEIESARKCQVNFLDAQGKKIKKHSPMLNALLIKLAANYDGKFVWEEEASSFSLFLPK